MAAATVVRRTQKRDSGRFPFPVFLPLGIAFLIIAGIAIYGTLSPYNAKPSPPAPGVRGSLVWGDGIFANSAQLKAWLRLHGASYDAWAKTHPRALTLVKPRRVRRSVAAKTKTVEKARARKVAAPAVITKKRTVHVSARSRTSPLRKTASAAPSSTTSSGFFSIVMVWTTLLIGLALGGVALAPDSLIAKLESRMAVRGRDLRLAALAAGAAVLVGAIMASVLG